MAHFAWAVVFFLAAQLCIRWNNLLMVRMIRSVNATRPADQQLSESFRKRRQSKMIEAEYQRLYPESRLPMWYTLSLLLGFLSFLLTALVFFKPSRK
jgi:hypothetical protein